MNLQNSNLSKTILYMMLLLFTTMFTSCSWKNKKTIWVSGFHTQCTNLGQNNKCLMINFKNDFSSSNWQKLTSDIDGFKFKESIMQKILVEELPYTKFKLLQVIESKTDFRASLMGPWKIINVLDEPINLATDDLTLNLNFHNMSVSGNDGCNQYNAKISSYDEDNIIFSRLKTTSKMCLYETISSKLIMALSKVSLYEVRQNMLYLFDENNNLLIKLSRPDLNVDYRLNDIWVVESLKDIQISKQGKRPLLEINLKTKMIMGNDTCNNYRAKINKVNDNVLILNPVVSTKKDCLESKVSIQYQNAINSVTSFKLEGLNLMFYNSENTELIKFRKID